MFKKIYEQLKNGQEVQNNRLFKYVLEKINKAGIQQNQIPKC